MITPKRSSIIILGLFLGSLLVCSAPRTLPILFSALSPKSVKILGNLTEFETSSTISGKTRTETYTIPLKGIDLLTFDVTLPPILYSYTTECSGINSESSTTRSFPGSHRTLNRSVLIGGLQEACSDLRIAISGPKLATRLTTGDGFVLAGNQRRILDLKWSLEFIAESLPVLLTIIFISIVILYNLSGVVFSRAVDSKLVYVCLWASSLFFVNQTGIVTRVIPFDINESLNSRVGVGLAIYAILLWLVIFTKIKTIDALVFFRGKNSTTRVAVFAAILALALASLPSYRVVLVVACTTLGAYLLFFGATRKNFVTAILGISLILDALKIFGVDTPFSSRVSWYFLCFALTFDSVIRQFSHSRTQWLLGKFNDEVGTNSCDLEQSVRIFERLSKAAFHFDSVEALLISSGNRLSADLRATANIIIPVGSEKLIHIKFGSSIWFDVPLPSARTGLRELTEELQHRLPIAFSRVLDQQTRKFDAAIDTPSTRGEEFTLNDFLRNFSERTGIRLFYAEYKPDTHQVKPACIFNYPKNIEERLNQGYLRALPENTYSPLSRGIHSDLIYYCQDVRLILPFLNENTVQFYEQARTISCFSFAVYRSGNPVPTGLIYAESSEIRFDEHFRPSIEKLRAKVELCLQADDLDQQLEKATTALSRFVPRTHVFALINGASVVEKDRGYLLMIDLKSSTKFSLKHGSDAWLERVEKLQVIIKPIIENAGMFLQTFSWDAAFITLSLKHPSQQDVIQIEKLSVAIGMAIETWALTDRWLTELWSQDRQKARFCLTFGDISRGLATGTTETWTVTGASMAVIAKMEAECKTLDGVLFTDLDANIFGIESGFTPTGRIIRSVEREIFAKFGDWTDFVSNGSLDGEAKRVA